MLKQRPLLTETREPVRGGCVACDFLAATADREDFFASRMLHDVLGLHQQHRQPPFLALGRGFGDRPSPPPRQIGLALAPRIKAGKLETAVFPVWDPVCKRVVRVTAYRQKPAKVVKPAKKG